MATMPGQNEQPKPSQPEGHQSPGTQNPQNWAQGPGGTQQQYQPPEPKRRENAATGQPEPNAHPKRAPEHEPGYEQKHQKEAKQQTKQDDANRRSQADDSKAQIDARDDEDALHRQKGQRAHTAARKTEVKRGRPAKSKAKPTRKHK